MANIIRIKRKALNGGSSAPSTLANAELAFNEDSQTLYYGLGTGGAGGSATSIVAIAGTGAFVGLSGDQTVAGTKTFSSVVKGATPDSSSNTTDLATTAWVRTYVSSITTGGTVTSVGLSLPAIFTVSNSPVTGSGTLTATLNSQVANVVFAGPSTGSAAAPTFRSLTATDIPTLTASKISDFDTQVRTSRLDQMAAPTANVSLNSQRITNLANPTDGTDAVNLNYLNSVRSGLDVKDSVKYATTANITLSGTSTQIDGYTPTAGDRILVKNQDTATENGIYVAASSGWSRATDADSNAEFTPGLFVFVEQGNTNADSGWVCTNDSIDLGNTNITFAQFSGAGQITAGSGLTKSGNTINAIGTSDRITVNADSIDIASTYVGQSSITTLGTISSGTWNANTIGVGYGGTGATSFTSNGIIYGNSTNALQVTSAGSWDSTNSVGQILSVNSSNVPTWTNTIDGGSY